MALTVAREFTDPASAELLPTRAQLCDDLLAPRAAAAEEAGEFPREVFRTLGAAGLLEPAVRRGVRRWGPAAARLPAGDRGAGLLVGLGRSGRQRAHPVVLPARRLRQRRAAGSRWLPDMLGGELLGAYCLSEADAGSDAAALQTRATPHRRRVSSSTASSAWISHGGVADFYVAMVRTSDRRRQGHHLPARRRRQPRTVAPGHRSASSGFSASPTAQMVFDDVAVPPSRRIGEEGAGLRDRARRAGRRPAGHGRLRGRHRAGGARPRRRLRHAAAAVRPADRRVPGAVVPAGRHGHPGRRRSRALPGRRPASATRGRAVRHSTLRWPSSSPPTWRCR